MILVPEFFAQRLVGMEPSAVGWLADLPALADEYAERWELRLNGAPIHGYVALVLPVVGADGTEAVLKLSYPTPESHGEPFALAAWKGSGAVRLLDSDPDRGVLLLERLDPQRSLECEPVGRAVETIAELARRLAIPAPPGLTRHLRAEAERLADELPGEWQRLGRPFPQRLLAATVDICRQLGPAVDDLLVNQDLHYANVLAGTREPWLVIDPQPLAGDLEYMTLSPLWSRLEESTLATRFATLVEIAALDPTRAYAWVLVRAVRHWLWFVEGGDTDHFGYPAVQQIAPWALEHLH